MAKYTKQEAEDLGFFYVSDSPKVCWNCNKHLDLDKCDCGWIKNEML